MNLILFDTSEVQDSMVVLRDARHTHIQSVLKAQVGDTLAVGELNGLMGQGEVVVHDDHATTLKVALHEKPPAPHPVTLCLALPRPIMLRRVLFNVAQLGVKDIHLFHSNRVEKSFWQSNTLQQTSLDELLREGLVQAKDTMMPTVTLHNKFKPFVQDVLPRLIKDKPGVVADPTGERSWPAPSPEPMTLIIGPEGGFIPYELEQFEALGCHRYSLGPRILRVETAVTVLLRT